MKCVWTSRAGYYPSHLQRTKTILKQRQQTLNTQTFQLTTPNSRALSAAGRRSEGELTRLLPGSAHGALRKAPAIGCLGAFTPGNPQGHRAGPCLPGG